MTFIQFIFYAFSTIAVVSGIMVVAAKNPVHGALFLVTTFVAMSGLWILLQAEFLALILVLVYVGAVMTLFLFVVMMLSVELVSLREGFVRYFPIGLVLVAMIVGIIYIVVGPNHFGLEQISAPQDLNTNNIADLGAVLYTDYVYPFEIAAVLLLTAIIAAIALTHHRKYKHKSQNPQQQIAVQAKDRIRLVPMQSANKGDKA